MSQNTIHLEGERAAKLHFLLIDIFDTIVSLQTAAKQFPSLTVARGEMHPTFTVEGFASALEAKVSTVMDMASGEDLKQAAREEH